MIKDLLLSSGKLVLRLIYGNDEYEKSNYFDWLIMINCFMLLMWTMTIVSLLFFGFKARAFISFIVIPAIIGIWAYIIRNKQRKNRKI